MSDVDRLPSGRWQARTRVDGRQVKRSFDRKHDAVQWLADVRADTARGRYVDDRAGRATLTEYSRRWAKSRPWSASTRRRAESFLSNHVEGHRLGGMALSSIRASDVQGWATGLTETLAPGTTRYGLTLVRAVLAAAVEDRVLAVTPASRVALPSWTRPTVDALTPGQVQDLAEAMPPWGRAMVVAQAGLGVRLGELLALRVEDVNFLRRTVRVEWQIRQGDGERVRPKTVQSRRTVPLAATIGDELARHVAAFPPGEDGVLFASPRGGPWEASYYGRVLKAAALCAGLPGSTSSHDLRHHLVSVLLDAGVGLPHVAALIGDSVVTVTKHYAHMVPGQDDRARAAIDAAWCARNVPVAPPEDRQGHG